MSRYAGASKAAMGSAHLDIYAMGMCTLCLVHCIALPLMSALLPIAGVVSNNELVHKLLVLLAAPATIWLVYKAALGKKNSTFIVLALIGLVLLLLAAFVELLSQYEVPLTLTGATVLGCAHLHRWLRVRQLSRSHMQSS